MKPLPTTFEQLVDELDEAFPNRCPDISESDREIWISVGTRKVVDHIRSRIEETEREEADVWKETVRTS